MANLLDTLKPRLSEAITYTAQEDRGMRPYNRFMTAVTESLPVNRMDDNAEMVFCIADRIFKPPFSLTATVSPALQAVNRPVLAENFARSMIV